MSLERPLAENKETTPQDRIKVDELTSLPELRVHLES